MSTHGFGRFSVFLHYFVLAKLATSSIMVNSSNSFIVSSMNQALLTEFLPPRE